MGLIHALFNNETWRTILFKTRYLLVLIFVGLLAVFMESRWLPWAFGVSMFGQLIQLWSLASLTKNQLREPHGPYVLSRNPMYLGRFFLILGPVLLFDSWIVVAVYVLLYYFYMVNRVGREEKRLAGAYGERYADYCRRVNRFLPSLGQLGERAAWYFDWAICRRNHGHWNVVLTLAGYAVLYAYTQYVSG